MEIKRYDDFSSLKPIEERIDEIINLFPELEDLIDIFETLDGFKLKHITPSLYRSSCLARKNWCGGLMIDDVHYFNIDRSVDRSQLEELFFQELIYPKEEFDEWFVKKWRSFSLMEFEVKNDKIKSKGNLAPCFRVKLEIENPSINSFNFNRDEGFESDINELKSYLKSRGLNFILLSPPKDSNFDIIVISEAYVKSL